ncbi:MAG: hypothetical protein DMG45_26115, partial [Acidobacteria bacterium]
MSRCLYTTLDSSLLQAAAYSTDETLQLEFRTGPVYRYFGVPSTIFQNLITATSKGDYFNRNARNSFRHQRVAGRSPFPPLLPLDFPQTLTLSLRILLAFSNALANSPKTDMHGAASPWQMSSIILWGKGRPSLAASHAKAPRGIPFVANG